MPRGIIPRQPAKSGRHEARPPRSARPPLRPSSEPLRRQPAPFLKPRRAPRGKRARSVRPPAGYNPVAPERIQEILGRLDATYPGATCALQHRSAWELLVATILSAQCTDVRVNLVTPELFRRHPTPKHFAALKPEELEPEIRSTGFFRNKSKAIVGAARQIVSQYGSEVPNEMEKLLQLPGVARKTANVVLGTWFKQASGVVVDTHVTRIARRLELTRNHDPQKIEQDLMSAIAREKWIDFAHQLIWHGRKLCLARQPKCAECPLENLCHAADKIWSTVAIHKTAAP